MSKKNLHHLDTKEITRKNCETIIQSLMAQFTPKVFIESYENVVNKEINKYKQALELGKTMLNLNNKSQSTKLKANSSNKGSKEKKEKVDLKLDTDSNEDEIPLVLDEKGNSVNSKTTKNVYILKSGRVSRNLGLKEEEEDEESDFEELLKRKGLTKKDGLPRGRREGKKIGMKSLGLKRGRKSGTKNNKPEKVNKIANNDKNIEKEEKPIRISGRGRKPLKTTMDNPNVTAPNTRSTTYYRAYKTSRNNFDYSKKQASNNSIYNKTNKESPIKNQNSLNSKGQTFDTENVHSINPAFSPNPNDVVSVVSSNSSDVVQERQLRVAEKQLQTYKERLDKRREVMRSCRARYAAFVEKVFGEGKKLSYHVILQKGKIFLFRYHDPNFTIKSFIPFICRSDKCSAIGRYYYNLKRFIMVKGHSGGHMRESIKDKILHIIVDKFTEISANGNVMGAQFLVDQDKNVTYIEDDKNEMNGEFYFKQSEFVKAMNGQKFGKSYNQNSLAFFDNMFEGGEVPEVPGLSEFSGKESETNVENEEDMINEDLANHLDYERAMNEQCEKDENNEKEKKNDIKKDNIMDIEDKKENEIYIDSMDNKGEYINENIKERKIEIENGELQKNNEQYNKNMIAKDSSFDINGHINDDMIKKSVLNEDNKYCNPIITKNNIKKEALEQKHQVENSMAIEPIEGQNNIGKESDQKDNSTNNENLETVKSDNLSNEKEEKIN